jgi:hypothetical protein
LCYYFLREEKRREQLEGGREKKKKKKKKKRKEEAGALNNWKPPEGRMEFASKEKKKEMPTGPSCAVLCCAVL